MEQRISIITLGATDLAAMKKFYTEKFGWKIEAQAKDIAFFKLNGLLLGLYGRDDLARFLKRSPQGSGFRPYNLAYMVRTDAEVHEIYKQFVSKGIKIASRRCHRSAELISWPKTLKAMSGRSQRILSWNWMTTETLFLTVTSTIFDFRS